MIELEEKEDTIVIECSACGNSEEIPKMMIQEMDL